MTSAKQVRAQYAQEFKLEAVRQVKAGQAIAGLPQPDAVRKTLVRGTAQKGRVNRGL